MPIPLEEEYKPGFPVVKRTALGQVFNGAVLKVDQRNRLRKDDATGRMVPALKPDGNPKKELVVICLVLPGTTSPVALAGEEHVPQPEEIVRLILKGKAFGDWIQSKKDLGRTVNVGDIVTQKTTLAQCYDQNGSPTGDEITDQSVLNSLPRGRSVGIYGPIVLRAPKEGSEWIAKAEKAYHALAEPIPAETDAAADNDFDDGNDDPPF